MKKAVNIIVALTILSASQALPQTPATFDEAKEHSVKQNKPILLEFFREEWEYCELAAREAASSEAIKNALTSVVHFSLNVKEGEGVELSKRCRVGAYFPAFYLMNNEGDIISRWTGYTTAQNFISSLQRALGDLTTIDERINRFENNTNLQDALFLAKYSSDTDDFLKAAEYYRKAQLLAMNGRIDYSFQIFENCVNAAWNDNLSFADVLPVADSVLASKRQTNNSRVKVAQYMIRLARKLGTTDRIATYLLAGINATTNSKDPKQIETHQNFRADSALYISTDTVSAIDIKKSSMIPDWETDPKSYYSFAGWCLERKINLPEAEMYARKASELASDGPFKAKNYNTLAEICFAQGKTDDAIYFTNLAIEQDPEKEFYVKQLERFTSSK